MQKLEGFGLSFRFCDYAEPPKAQKDQKLEGFGLSFRFCDYAEPPKAQKAQKLEGKPKSKNIFRTLS